MKRATVHVFDSGEIGVALSVQRFLRRHGIDARVVTKHAVQILPDQQDRAAELLRSWEWGWDRKDKAS